MAMEIPVHVSTPPFEQYGADVLCLFKALRKALPRKLRQRPRAAGHMVLKLQPSGTELKNVALSGWAIHPITGESGAVTKDHISLISKKLTQAFPSIKVATPDTLRKCYQGLRPPSGTPDRKLKRFAQAYLERINGLLDMLEQLNDTLGLPPAAQGGQGVLDILQHQEQQAGDNPPAPAAVTKSSAAQGSQTSPASQEQQQQQLAGVRPQTAAAEDDEPLAARGGHGAPDAWQQEQQQHGDSPSPTAAVAGSSAAQGGPGTPAGQEQQQQQQRAGPRPPTAAAAADQSSAPRGGQAVRGAWQQEQQQAGDSPLTIAAVAEPSAAQGGQSAHAGRKQQQQFVGARPLTAASAEKPGLSMLQLGGQNTAQPQFLGSEEEAIKAAETDVCQDRVQKEKRTLVRHDQLCQALFKNLAASHVNALLQGLYKGQDVSPYIRAMAEWLIVMWAERASTPDADSPEAEVLQRLNLEQGSKCGPMLANYLGALMQRGRAGSDQFKEAVRAAAVAVDAAVDQKQPWATKVAKQGVGDGQLRGRCVRACQTPQPYASRDTIGQVVRDRAAASLQGTAQSALAPADLKLPYYLPPDVQDPPVSDDVDDFDIIDVLPKCDFTGADFRRAALGMGQNAGTEEARKLWRHFIVPLPRLQLSPDIWRCFNLVEGTGDIAQMADIVCQCCEDVSVPQMIQQLQEQAESWAAGAVTSVEIVWYSVWLKADAVIDPLPLCGICDVGFIPRLQSIIRDFVKQR